MARRSRAEKPLYPFSNDAVFGEVMLDPEVCRRVIERCIGRKVASVRSVETQKVVRADLERRSIRCDVCMEDAEGVLYDVEMQVETGSDLPFRLRGYQSVLDASRWRPGEEFADLGRTYVIFLCAHDPFSLSMPVYEIERCIMGDRPRKVETHAHWVALNASAWAAESDPDLRNLLRYVHEGRLPQGDELIEDIDFGVRRVNRDPVWRFQMITYEQKQRIHAQNMVAEAVEEATRRVTEQVTEQVRSDALDLYERLEEAGRLSEYKRALADDGFRKELESELGL